MFRAKGSKAYFLTTHHINWESVGRNSPCRKSYPTGERSVTIPRPFPPDLNCTQNRTCHKRIVINIMNCTTTAK